VAVHVKTAKKKTKNKKNSQLCREPGWLGLGKDGKLLTRILALPRAFQAGSWQRKALPRAVQADSRQKKIKKN
jgi:hypothetical protein